MGLTNIHALFLRLQGEITRRCHLSENELAPDLPRLLLIVELKVLTDKPGGSLDDLDNFVVEDVNLTGK